MLGYEQVEGFERVYLEDSFVLQIEATPGMVRLVVDVVLLEGHPDYRPPHPGEQHSYGRMHISFRSVTRLQWSEQGKPPAIDSTGEPDLGGFDEFSPLENGWLVAGDWGVLSIECESPPTIESFPSS